MEMNVALPLDIDSIAKKLDLPTPATNDQPWDIRAHVVACANAAKLTPKESQIYELTLKGLMAQEIAAALGNSIKTVKSHQERIYAKFGVRTRNELSHAIFPL
jgi:DNA-binding CsgD family transcriptional regulator